MTSEPEQVQASRILLREVCQLFAVHIDDVVLVGGWVPDILFPNASPSHEGSIDVDVAMRLQNDAHQLVVDSLHQKGFKTGKHSYQFLKDVQIENGRKIVVRLDLLSSLQTSERLSGSGGLTVQAVHGADIAFRDNRLEQIDRNDELHMRVAGIVAFLTMKSLALHDRAKPKDAYDILFCLENYADKPDELREAFRSLQGDELVVEGLSKLAQKFRSENDDGPRMVAEFANVFGDFRAARKLAAFVRVDEFLASINGTKK